MQRFLLGTVLACAVSSLATAGGFVISDGNSSFDYDDSSGVMYNWYVDGVDHLFDQSFYYRAAGMNDEANISTLGLVSANAFNTNSDPALDTVNTVYGAGGVRVETTYRLSGGLPGSNTADIAEQIRISNTSGSALSLTFFQYCDFDLNGSIGGDIGLMPFPNTAQQYEGSIVLSETVVTPAPSNREVSIYPTLIGSFSDGMPTNLNGNTGPLGPGDVVWAFQWDFTIPNNGSVLISKDKLITPEPTSMALLALGSLALLARRR